MIPVANRQRRVPVRAGDVRAVVRTVFLEEQGGDPWVSVALVNDRVIAEVDVSGNDHLPRTPPMRYGMGLELQWAQFTGSIDYLRVDEQTNVTDFELVSDAYNDLGAYVGVELVISDTSTLGPFLRGKNLTNDEQRIHTSFIKEFAPAPGRTVEAGIRWIF